MNINYLKVLIIGLTIVCMTILMALHSISETVAIAIIGPLVGYLVGNGVATKQGISSPPVFAPKEDGL